jgi:DNA-binding SARP family transcriptional activator
LRVALHGLRRVCGTPGAAESSASPVRSDPERIYLEAGAYQLDADEFQAARRKCLEMSQLGLTAEAIRAGQAAAGLYGGQFMAGDVYSEWCSGRRTEMNEMFIDLVLQLGALLVSEGRWSDAAHAYRRATIASPESEVAARGFMRAAWKSGRALDALNEYSRLASALWSGHRTRPSAETKAVRDEIARSIETAAGSGPAPAASAGHVTTSKSRSGARL